MVDQANGGGRWGDPAPGPDGAAPGGGQPATAPMSATAAASAPWTPVAAGVVAAPVAFERKTGPNLLVRAIWYTFVGWWVTGLGMLVAWLAALTVIGIPFSFWLVNRLPTMLTLRPRREQYQFTMGDDGVVRTRTIQTQQSGILVGATWFILVGWWLSALWMGVAYLMLLTVILIPVGLLMVNRVPFIFSLHRGYA